MFEVDCKDITLIECTYVGKGATIEEVKQKALAHTRTAHRDALSSLTPKQLDDMDRLLTSKIRQVG